IFDAQIEVCQALIADLDQRAAAHGDLVLELVHDFRRRQAVFIVEWLRVCRERLSQGVIA
ncbi:MAG: hypothetical protein DCC57_20145, partial [Chloroflexi bacterium]